MSHRREKFFNGFCLGAELIWKNMGKRHQWFIQMRSDGSSQQKWIQLQVKCLHNVPSWWNFSCYQLSYNASCGNWLPSTWATNVRLGLIQQGQIDGCIISSCWLVVCCRHSGPQGRRSGQTKVRPPQKKSDAAALLFLHSKIWTCP